MWLNIQNLSGICFNFTAGVALDEPASWLDAGWHGTGIRGKPH